MTLFPASNVEAGPTGVSSRSINLTIVVVGAVLPFAAQLNGSQATGTIRAVVVVAYLLIFPGLTLIRAVRIDLPQWTPALSVVTSIAMGVLVSVIWAYVGDGSWQPPFVAIGLISVVLAAVRLIVDLQEVSS